MILPLNSLFAFSTAAIQNQSRTKINSWWNLVWFEVALRVFLNYHFVYLLFPIFLLIYQQWCDRSAINKQSFCNLKPTTEKLIYSQVFLRSIQTTLLPKEPEYETTVILTNACLLLVKVLYFICGTVLSPLLESGMQRSFWFFSRLFDTCQVSWCLALPYYNNLLH